MGVPFSSVCLKCVELIWGAFSLTSAWGPIFCLHINWVHSMQNPLQFSHFISCSCTKWFIVLNTANDIPLSSVGLKNKNTTLYNFQKISNITNHMCIFNCISFLIYFQCRTWGFKLIKQLIKTVFWNLWYSFCSFICKWNFLEFFGIRVIKHGFGCISRGS
jgi:hypothetical protein